MSRNWFTEHNTSDLAKADLNLLNRAAQRAFRPGYQPTQRELTMLRTIYRPGMSVNALLDELDLEIELIRHNGDPQG